MGKIKFGRELVIAFLMGSVPISVAFYKDGVKGLSEALDSYVSVSGVAVYYPLALLSFFLLISLFRRNFIVRSDLGDKFFKFTVDVLSQVGGTIMGMFRALCGILLIFPFIWAFFDDGSFFIAGGAFLFGVGALVLLECALMSALIDWMMGWQTKGDYSSKMLFGG